MFKKQYPELKNKLDDIYDLYNRDLISFQELTKRSKNLSILEKTKKEKKKEKTMVKIKIDESLIMYPIITKTILKGCEAKEFTKSQYIKFGNKKRAFKVLENNSYNVIVNRVSSRYGIEVSGRGGFVMFTIPLEKLNYFVKEMKKKGIK